VSDRELAACVRRVRQGAPRAVARELAELERRRGRAEELGSRAARTAAATLDARTEALAAAGARLARSEDRRLDALTDRLRALDPARVLERGYSITRDGDGRVVKRAAALQAGDHIVTEFRDGRAGSTVDTRELMEP
jgi:exodeoxyribonuclease VII large subunit